MSWPHPLGLASLAAIVRLGRPNHQGLKGFLFCGSRDPRQDFLFLALKNRRSWSGLMDDEAKNAAELMTLSLALR